MCRVRVVKGGSVIGSLPAPDARGYMGADAANYKTTSGTIVSFVYVGFWVDDDRRPLASASRDSGPSFLYEHMLVAAIGHDEAALAQIPGWLAETNAEPAAPADAFDFRLIAMSS
ncbi:MAG TPA: hypothetical protein VHT00_08140 [Stellaceae bacterium]|jgi:hypothetical protein|nr:hypothetical protein [Stellaceae bacterium]HEX3416475.1 hypothetical protein [Stellaceae bacterium]